MQTTDNDQEQDSQIEIVIKHQKTKENPILFMNQIPWTDETCVRMMGREKSEEGKEQFVIQSIPHHVSNLVEAAKLFKCVCKLDLCS